MRLPRFDITRIETKLLISITLISSVVFILASVLFIQFSSAQILSARQDQSIRISENQASLIEKVFVHEQELLLSLVKYQDKVLNSDLSKVPEFVYLRNGRTCLISPFNGIKYEDSIEPHTIPETFSFQILPSIADHSSEEGVAIKLLKQDSLVTFSTIPVRALDETLERYDEDIASSFYSVSGKIFYAPNGTVSQSNTISDSLKNHIENLLYNNTTTLKLSSKHFMTISPVPHFSGWYVQSSTHFHAADPLQSSWMKFYAVTILSNIFLVSIFLNMGVRSIILKRLETLKKILNKEWVDGASFTTLQGDDEIGELVSAFQKMSQQIQRKVEMEQLIGGVWRSLAKSDQSNHSDTVDTVLRKMGVFIESDRTYFLVLSNDSSTISLSNGWNREGVTPFTLGNDSIESIQYPWLMKELRKGEIIYFSPFEDFSNTAGDESNLWSQSTGDQSILALLFIPLFIKDTLIGCIGIDSIISKFDLNHSELHYLTMIAESISNSVDKFRTTVLIEKQNHQLQQSQKMETVGLLAGGIAHDFNNILAGIVSSTSLFIDENSGQKSVPYSELTSYLDTVKSAGDRAVSVVQQLLALSRKQEYNFEVVDLNNIIEQTVQISTTSFDKRISISIEKDDIAAMIKADATQIEQVLLNFVMNSVHAMTIMREHKSDWGGNLRVKLERVLVDQQFLKMHPVAFENSYWKISVSDTGVGISESEYAKIYEPFYTTKKKGIGTGLGLSMVYRIIQEHFGFVELESEVGVGTTFNIYLPEEEGIEMEKQEVVSKKIETHKNATILIVDDEPLLRKIASRILTSEGHTVLTAEDGGEAVEIFTEKSDSIDAIILDLIMPVMSGDDTYRELIKIKPDIPVLISSGFRKDERVDSLLKSGVAGFLQKPYSVEAMKEIIKEILQ